MGNSGDSTRVTGCLPMGTFTVLTALLASNGRGAVQVECLTAQE